MRQTETDRERDREKETDRERKKVKKKEKCVCVFIAYLPMQITLSAYWFPWSQSVGEIWQSDPECEK